MASMVCCLQPFRALLISLVCCIIFGNFRSAVAKAGYLDVTIDSGANIMKASSVELSTFDAFTSEFPEFAVMSLAEGSGCVLSGLELHYVYPGTNGIKALDVRVDVLNTTVIAQSNMELSLESTSMGDIIGTHGNEYVLNILCHHPPAALLFPEACAFFTPSNLAKICFAFAPLLRTPEGRSFAALSSDDPFVLSTTDLQLLHTDMRFDLQSARGSPCRTSGLSLRYVLSSLLTSALKVDVTDVSVVVWASSHMTKIFTRLQLGDLVGSHTYTDFLVKVCQTAAKQVLPKACDFFAPSHLGHVCEPLSSLLWDSQRDFKYRLVDDTLARAQDPFMLRPPLSTAYTADGTALHLFQATDATPCTSVGLELRYFHNGSSIALEVEVLPALATVTASTEVRTVLSKAGLLDMVGVHNIVDFRAKMCRVQGRHLFPYACDFLAYQHLGSLCASLSFLLAESAQAWLKTLQ